MNNIIKSILASIVALSLQMCTVEVPENAESINAQPAITPDYADLTIPVNIAPLNFSVDEKGEKFLTSFRTKNGTHFTIEGRSIDIDIDKWHNMLSEAKGDTVYVDVYVQNGKTWKRYNSIKYKIAEEIDPYITYRHIEPLYVNFNSLQICQRNLENFEIDEIYNNSAFLNTEGDKQCINCHSVQDYNRNGNLQMHVRVVNPGTVINHNGELKKVNLKVGKAYSAGAYLSWHPKQPVIAYSINGTWQHFHSVDNNKVEVQDDASDIMIYDVEKNTVRMLTESTDALETFPYWSHDGKRLYYISAKVPEMTPKEMANYRINNYKDIKYNILKRDYDANTGKFGDVDTVFNASVLGKSATFPRESPDGRYLLFTLGEYGTFHNFHHDADLYMMDLTTGDVKCADALNSDDTESYHSWSSNGRWILLSSRRGNGSYTRLYIAYFDKDGKASKPFLLPQKSPSSDKLLFKSYNVPEFMVKPVDISRKEWIDVINSEPINAIYKE